MTDERFRSFGQFHDSFADSKANLLGNQNLVRTRQNELDLLRRNIGFTGEYVEMRRLLDSGLKLTFTDAVKVAAFESSALFLSDPTLDAVKIQTPAVFRQIRMLETSGVLKEGSLKGNLLLVGSGTSVHEIQGLNAVVDITDPLGYQQAAINFYNLLEGHSGDVSRYDEVVFSSPQSLRCLQEVAGSVVLRPRFSGSQTVTCVEPDISALKAIHVPRIRKLPIDYDSIRALPVTVSEYLGRDKTKFSFVMFRRTDPAMWTPDLEGTDVYQRLERLSQLRGDRKAFRKETADIRESKKALHKSFRYIIQGLSGNLSQGSQIYISIGWGNNDNELGQRGALIGLLGAEMSGFNMNPVSFLIDDAVETGFWVAEGDDDSYTLVGEVTGPTFSRIGISTVAEVSEGSGGSKKKRRRH